MKEALLRAAPAIAIVVILFLLAENGEAAGGSSGSWTIGDPIITGRDHGDGPWNDWGTGPDQYDEWLRTQ